MAQQALASPIEITALNNTITINYNGAGDTAVSLALGTHGSILTVINSLDALVGTVDAELYAYLDTSHKVVIKGISTFTITWTDTPFMRMLGFRTDMGAATTQTATDTPRYMWIPPYYSADLNHPEDDTAIAGGNAIDGTFSGISLAPGNYMRQYQWQAVASEDVLKSACEASYTYGSVYYPEQERCLEEFTINALSASPTGTEGISIKGCYYVEDLASYEGASAGASKCPSSMDGGGVRTRLTSSPDNYTFCHLKPARWTKPVPTIDTHNSLYNVGVELITAIGGVPTWSKP
jgi:hypothetical protein